MLSQPDFSEALNEEEMEEIKVTTIVPSRAAMNRTTHRLAMITANLALEGIVPAVVVLHRCYPRRLGVKHCLWWS